MSTIVTDIVKESSIRRIFFNKFVWQCDVTFIVFAQTGADKDNKHHQEDMRYRISQKLIAYRVNLGRL